MTVAARRCLRSSRIWRRRESRTPFFGAIISKDQVNQRLQRSPVLDCQSVLLPREAVKRVVRLDWVAESMVLYAEVAYRVGDKHM